MNVRCSVAATMVWASPDVVRPVDGPALQPVPDLEAWVAGLSPDQRVDLQGRTETQLVRDEPVRVLGKEGAWARIVVPGQASSKSPDGYPGWVLSSHLGVLGEPAGPEPDPAQGLTTLDALAAAARLLGSPYVWGGCGAAGIDCSGLVLHAHRALGRPIPRDARDQRTAAREVPLGERRRGDIVFFARPGKPAHHVGFDAGEGCLLHATMRAGRGTVECVPMPEEYADTVVAAGRFLPTP
jgi:gamma-D-glutamyl-L-lysine dipeptidyl-peptidase